jgi:hypothetical protein
MRDDNLRDDNKLDDNQLDPAPDGERGDVPGWVLVTLNTV